MLKSFQILSCVQEMGEGLQVGMPMVGGEYSHSTLLVRVPSTYVWSWPILQRSYVQNPIKLQNYRLSSSSYIERGHYQICWKSTCVYRHPVCESGCEAAIYSMSQFFNEDDSEAVLSIDASNDFNAVNCQLLLHNVSPKIAVFIRSCYSLPSRLFIVGGSELKLCEETTKEDLRDICSCYNTTTFYASRSSRATTWKGNQISRLRRQFYWCGSISNLLHWWNILTTLSSLFGYHLEPTKCWLIVKSRMKYIALKTLENIGINIADGKCHLRAVIGSIEYRENCVIQKVKTWLD